MMKNLFSPLNPLSDINFKAPSMMCSVIAIFILHCYFIVTALDSLFNLIVCVLSLLLLPSPYPALCRKLRLLLKRNELTRLTLSELEQYGQQARQLYLGTGFKWQPQHARLLQEQLSSGLDNSSSGRHGSFAVHNLEIKNHRKLFMPVNDLNLHTMIFGTTGAGKTRLFDLLVSQAIMRKDTVIVIDPKSDADLQKRITAAAQHCSRHVKLHILDLARTRHSSGINPLGTFLRPSEIASRITSLMPDAGSSQSFKAHAHSAITAAVAVLKLQKKAITLKNVLKTLDHQELFALILDDYLKDLIAKLKHAGVTEFYKELDKGNKSLNNNELDFFNDLKIPTRKNINNLLFTLEKTYDYICDQGFIQEDGDIITLLSVAKMDPGYYQKLSASVMPYLRTLCSADLNALLSSEEPGRNGTLEELAADNGIFYAALNCLGDPVLGGYLGKLLIADLCALAGKIYTQKEYQEAKPTAKISVFIDESSEAAGEAMVQLLNKSRGADFAVTIATQTYADLVKRTGSEASARQIIGNCNNKISLRLKDTETAKIFAENLPTTEEPRRGSSISFNEDAAGLDAVYGVSSSVSMQKCPVFPAEALQYLPDLEFVAALSDSTIFKGRLPLLSVD